MLIEGVRAVDGLHAVRVGSLAKLLPLFPT